MNIIKCRIWDNAKYRYCVPNEVNLSIDDFGELYVWKNLLDKDNAYSIEFATSFQYINDEDVYIGDIFIDARGISKVTELYGTQFQVEKLEEFVDTPMLSATFIFGKKLGTIHDVFSEGYYKQEYDKFIESLIGGNF